ncbi:MAG: serine/threonine-protein kinase, partial [Myxococcota bacterium]
MLSKPIKLSTFHLHAPIGHGAMGMVWQGEHAFEKTPVAIKVIMPHRAQEARYAQLFRREVRAIAALDHPGIIRIYDHGIIDAAAATRSQGRLIEGSPYLVMEWSPLKPLASPSNPVPHWNALKSVLLGILDVLAHVHARGIIHRDLKPANVLADPLKLGIQGLKVIDFGLARIHSLLGASTQEAGGVVGTPGYMAPEQRSYAQLHTQGPWTDLYALGRVAWWLSMQNPNMRDPEQVYQTLNKPHALNPRFEIPEGFQDWLRCL